MQNSPTDLPITKIVIPIAPTPTTLCTDGNEVDVAVAIVIVDAEEKRIIDMVRVLALTS